MDVTPATISADSPRKALASWLSAFNARNAEALMALYDPEAVYANDNAPLMRGIDAIRPWFENTFASTTAKALFKEEALIHGTEISLIVGKFYLQASQQNPDEELGETGRVVTVFRRSHDGQWRLIFDMDNRPPDVQPSDFA